MRVPSRLSVCLCLVAVRCLGLAALPRVFLFRSLFLPGSQTVAALDFLPQANPAEWDRRNGDNMGK